MEPVGGREEGGRGEGGRGEGGREGGGREELGRQGPFSLSHFSPSPPPLPLFEPWMANAQGRGQVSCQIPRGGRGQNKTANALPLDSFQTTLSTVAVFLLCTVQ